MAFAFVLAAVVVCIVFACVGSLVFASAPVQPGINGLGHFVDHTGNVVECRSHDHCAGSALCARGTCQESSAKRDTQALLSGLKCTAYNPCGHNGVCDHYVCVDTSLSSFVPMFQNLWAVQAQNGSIAQTALRPLQFTPTAHGMPRAPFSIVLQRYGAPPFFYFLGIRAALGDLHGTLYVQSSDTAVVSSLVTHPTPSTSTSFSLQRVDVRTIKDNRDALFYGVFLPLIIRKSDDDSDWYCIVRDDNVSVLGVTGNPPILQYDLWTTHQTPFHYSTGLPMAGNVMIGQTC